MTASIFLALAEAAAPATAKGIARGHFTGPGLRDGGVTLIGAGGLSKVGLGGSQRVGFIYSRSPAV
jgi:hypothetical protein